jgi:hypothetical protein
LLEGLDAKYVRRLCLVSASAAAPEQANMNLHAGRMAAHSTNLVGIVTTGTPGERAASW